MRQKLGHFGTKRVGVVVNIMEYFTQLLVHRN